MTSPADPGPEASLRTGDATDKDGQANVRGNDRLRRVHLTSAASVVGQGVTIAVGLVSVPLTVGYLGQERYGVWVTLSSLLTWLAVTDLGLGGNALVNALAEAHGKEDRAWARELVATAFWTLAGIGGVLLVATAAVVPWVSWRSVFNVSAATSETELARALLVALTLFALAFPASVTHAIFSGYQEGYLDAAISILGSVASLLALLLVVRSQGGLPVLVLALYGARHAAAAGGGLVLFGTMKPWLRPTPAAVSRRALRRLVGLGVQYLVAQLAGIGIFQSQPIIVTHVLGPKAVGIFSIAQRILTLPLMFVQLLVGPLMPAYGEARARGDWVWILATLRRSLLYSVAIVVGVVVPLALVSQRLIRLWVGPELAPTTALVAALAGYVALAALVTPLSVLLYGIERVHGQARIAVINAVVTVLGTLWLTPRLGLPGTALAMGIGMLGVQGSLQLLELRWALKQGRGAGVT